MEIMIVNLNCNKEFLYNWVGYSLFFVGVLFLIDGCN